MPFIKAKADENDAKALSAAADRTDGQKHSSDAVIRLHRHMKAGRMSVRTQRDPFASDKALDWSYTPGPLPQHHRDPIHSAKHIANVPGFPFTVLAKAPENFHCSLHLSSI